MIRSIRILAGLACLALLTCTGFAQPSESDAKPDKPSATLPAFDIADVHASAHTTAPFFTGGSLRGDHYILHNATMVDMVSLAYGTDRDNVLSGPAWLDTDRFDVYARAPRATS